MNGIIFSSSPGCGGEKRQFIDEILGLLRLCGVVVLVPLRSDVLFVDGFRIARIVTRVGWRRDGTVGGRVLRDDTCGLPYINLRHTLHSSSAHTIDGAASSNELE